MTVQSLYDYQDGGTTQQRAPEPSRDSCTVSNSTTTVASFLFYSEQVSDLRNEN